MQQLDTIVSNGFSRTVAEALSAGTGEPEWARSRRLDAWRVYEDTPMPSRTTEGWRRIDLSGLDLSSRNAYAPAPSRTPARLLAEMDRAGERAGLVAQANSEMAARDLLSDLAKRGVVFTGLDQALREHPDLLESRLLRQGILPAYNKFAALNAAFRTGGLLLYVPRNTSVELPFVSLRWLEAPGGSAMPRTVIVVEEGASAVFVDDAVSEAGSEADALHCGITDIFVGDGAAFRYVGLQEWGRRVWDFSFFRANLGRGARFNAVLGSLGARVSRVHLEALMIGDSAEATLRGIYFGDRDQHFDYRTLQDHLGPRCSSDLLFKGALKNRASASYEGTVHVGRGAVRTSANQANRNLLLNPGAKADSEPILEIEASDIARCSHGATVGQVDEEQLYYLRSRGLTREAAAELIVTGFFDPVIASLPLESFRERLREAVAAKLAGAPVPPGDI